MGWRSAEIGSVTGMTITIGRVYDDVPAGALAVARGREHVSDSWVAARHPGSKADEAARNSTGDIHPAVQASRQALAADAAKNSSQDN